MPKKKKSIIIKLMLITIFIYLLFLIVCIVFWEPICGIVGRKVSKKNEEMEAEMEAEVTISRLKLSETDKAQMNYEELCEDIRYIYTGKGHRNAKVKFQFYNLEKVFKNNIYINEALNDIDLKKFVKGGEAPITFSKKSGPEWIYITDNGILSGTPTEETEDHVLLVVATDSENKTIEGKVIIPAIKETSSSNEEDVKENTLSKMLAMIRWEYDANYYGDGYRIYPEKGVMDAFVYNIYKDENDEEIGEIVISAWGVYPDFDIRDEIEGDVRTFVINVSVGVFAFLALLVAVYLIIVMFAYGADPDFDIRNEIKEDIRKFVISVSVMIFIFLTFLGVVYLLFKKFNII